MKKIKKMKRKYRSLSKRTRNFINDMLVYTPIMEMALLLMFLWMIFAAGLYAAEMDSPSSTITSYGRALYWGIAAFSTAGIADMPVSGWGELIGGVWILVGSMLFFGTIVGTITAYFMRPLQRPSKRIIDTIEYNLEQLDDLTVEELELLRNTTNSLIEHVEQLKSKQSRSGDDKNSKDNKHIGDTVTSKSK